MSSALNLRNQAIEKTIQLLEDVIKKSGDDVSSTIVKKLLRDMLINRTLEMFDNEEIDMLTNVRVKLQDLLNYSDKTHMFDYKLGEIVHHLRNILEPTTPKLFSLN